MAADAKFHIGNLERLLTLPVPSDRVQAAPVRAGAVLTALNGRRTVQTLGYSRSWEFTFNAVTLDESAQLESLYLGNIKSPYYMFDPMRKNLLPRAVAAPVTDELHVGYTPFNWNNVSTWQIEHTSPLTAPVPSATATLRVTTGTTSDNYIRRQDKNHLGEPIIPGKAYTHSVYVNVVSGSFMPYITFRDANGTDLANVGPSMFSTTGWNRATHTQTAPANAVYAETGIYVPNTGFSGSIGPAQLEVDTAANPWVPGYGTPKVSVESLSIDYPRFGIANVTATILEL